MRFAVTVTRMEVLVSALVGADRRYESVTNNRETPVFHEEKNWDMEIEGAIAELVYAKLRDRYWKMGVNTFKTGDVGIVEVRHTRRRDGRLIVRPEDPVEAPYVLVVGMLPKYEVIGYIYGTEARKIGSWENPNNKGFAWWVSQSDLTPFTPKKNGVGVVRNELKGES